MTLNYLEGAEKFYDLFGDKDDVEFYVAQAQKHRGRALELGVGTARLAIHLAQAGVETWGIDTSRHMLKAAEANVSRESPEVRARLHMSLGNAMDFSLPQRFKMIYFPSCSFDHILDPAQQRAALLNIRRHLAPGGSYVFDLYVAEELKAVRGWFVQRKSLEDDSTVVRSGYHVTWPEKRLMSLDMWYDHVVDGRVVERFYEGSEVYVHDAQSMRGLLEETGYEVMEEYGDHHGKPYRDGDSLIVLVTRPKKT
ncbi:MAG: class I SAM-dependent methyltransferase [Candidatus Bathyarchaeota archaeon]